MLKSITVVGGGTTGYICALMLKASFEDHEVNLVYSKDIPIIGVGEGSTEHWKTFMLHTGIKIKELIQETDATYKLGVKFVNWLKEDYYHSVVGDSDKYLADYPYLLGYAIANNLNENEMFIGINENISETFVNHTRGDITNQFHFDTFKLNEFLKKKAIQRKVNVYEDTVKDIELDENGFITKIKGNHIELKSDYYIDCTGFAKLIMNKKYGIPFKSYKKYLPLDRAFVFPTEYKENETLPFFTFSRALKYGWNFIIPTQLRKGNGYIYQSDFVSDEEAIKEMEDVYGFKIKDPKKLKFEAGCLEKYWYKNCIAIGLSSSFIEPLEATSIATVIQQTFCLIHHLPSNDVDNFNKKAEAIYKNLVDFVLLHYLINKEDSEFWKNNKNSIELTDSLKNILNIAQKRLLQPTDLKYSWPIFQICHYNCILRALNLFNKNNVAKEFNFHAKHLKDIAKLEYDNFQFRKNVKTLTHKEIIDKIKLNIW